MPRPRASDFRRVVESSLWFVLSEAGARALSFLAVLYLTRTLTLAGMGAVEFGFSVFTFTQLASTGGIGILVMRRAATSTRGLGRLAGTALLVAWCHWIVVLAVLAAGVWILPTPAMRQSALLFGLAAGVVPLAPRFALVAREHARIVAAAIFAAQATYLGLCLLAVRAPEHLMRVPLLVLASGAVQAALQLAGFVAAYGPLRLRVRPRRLAAWLRATLALDPGALARNLTLGVDLLLLGALVSAEEVARYAIALKVPLFLMTITGLTLTAVFPALARARAGGEQARLAAMQADVLRAALGGMLPGVLALAAVGTPLMVLLFTDRFRAAAPLFALLLWRVPLTVLIGLFRSFVWIEQPAAEVRIAVRGLATSVVAIVTLVPLVGTAGAAFGILLGDLVLLVLYARHPSVPRGSFAVDARALATLGLALALAAGVAWEARALPPVTAIATALAAWVAAGLVANARYARRLWQELR
jgi:O-antigen/teichoic acid export membrane protein